MYCKYCHQYITNHPRCILYESQKISHYCYICSEGICMEKNIFGTIVESVHILAV